MTMEWWQQIEFERPWVFALTVPIGIAFFLWLRSGKRDGTFIAIPSDHLLPGGRNFASLLNILPLITLTAMIFALAGPKKTWQEEVITAEGIDIFLVMDLSSSMLSRDFEPDRLTVSKAVAQEFVDNRPYDRLGLVAFAGEAYTQSPLTTDSEIIKLFLRDLEVGVLEDGTAIGMGLAAAVNRLKGSAAETKVAILLTDGVNNRGYISPVTATELAIAYDIRVYTIGIGSEGTAYSPVRQLPNGEFQFGLSRVQIDEELLRDIAASTGGKYYRATSAEVLQEIYAEIDELEKTEIDVTVIKRKSNFFRPFVYTALGTMIFFIFARDIILKVLP